MQGPGGQRLRPLAERHCGGLDRSSDVAVGGGGIVGLTIALALAEAGAGTVVVYERSGVNAGMSGVQPGGFRRQWSSRLNVELAQESWPFYRDLGVEFTACGYVFAASTEETLAQLRRDVELQNSLGVASRIVDPSDVVPGVPRGRFLGAAYCAQDGYFDQPQSVVEAVAARVHVEIADVVALDPGWTLRFADGSSARAGTVVVAAHLDSRALIPELPLDGEERVLFLSEPIRERLLEPLFVAVDERFAAKQLANGRVLASDLAGESRERIRAAIEQLVPQLTYVDFPVVARGVYDVTPDGQPVVGAVRDDLWVACGFGGHGFMLAPAVAQRLAAAIVEGRTERLLVDEPDARVI